jgi:hypothetical protein
MGGRTYRKHQKGEEAGGEKKSRNPGILETRRKASLKRVRMTSSSRRAEGKALNANRWSQRKDGRA